MKTPRLFAVAYFCLTFSPSALRATETTAAEAPAPPASTRAEATEAGAMPFVYTDWEHFTVEEGLPNDHIFAVKAAGPYVWIGTEGGLARYDKRSGKFRAWTEADGLPWRVVSAIDVHPETGEIWLGLFGGGIARFSGGRFDHFHQLNSGLVNDVVYGVAVEGDNIWAATTAGASRFTPGTDQWTIFTEKNSPMEEIWNYSVSAGGGKVYLAVWGSGVLEFDTATERWRDYLDPDREMEIDLYRDDGIVHVITTATNVVENILWVSTYFGMSRYDGRHWRGYYAHETGLPSDFGNAVLGRSADEAWFSTDQGLGVLTDFESDTWVTYTMDPERMQGVAVVSRGGKILRRLELPRTIPHNYVLCTGIDGNDVWVGTSKGLARARGKEYYPKLREQKGEGGGRSNRK